MKLKSVSEEGAIYSQFSLNSIQESQNQFFIQGCRTCFQVPTILTLTPKMGSKEDVQNWNTIKKSSLFILNVDLRHGNQIKKQQKKIFIPQKVKLPSKTWMHKSGQFFGIL